MNKAQRTNLIGVSDTLKSVKDIVESSKAIIEGQALAEQDKYDNLSENLQMADSGFTLEENANELNSAAAELGFVIDSLDTSIESIKKATDG